MSCVWFLRDNCLDKLVSTRASMADCIVQMAALCYQLHRSMRLQPSRPAVPCSPQHCGCKCHEDTQSREHED